MRISDWSSDVCSSDLIVHLEPFFPHRPVHRVDIIVEHAFVLGNNGAAHDKQRVDREVRVEAEFRQTMLVDEAPHFEMVIGELRGDTGILEHRRLVAGRLRSEENTSELQSLMRISYAV